MKKHLLIPLFIFILALFLRVYQLGNIPVSLSDDEVRLVYNAYSIWETGRDINGKFLPPVFLNSGYAFNPVPIYLTSPFVGILSLNMFSARLPFAVAGSLTVLLVYLIVITLLKNRWIALFSALVLAFNAWHLQISRIAYEGTIALFFYMLGTYLFIRNRYLFLSLVSFVLGFYSYSGYKILFLPILLILTWYGKRKLHAKQLMMIAITMLSTFLLFWYLSSAHSAASYGENQFFFQNIQATAQAVELERRASPAPEFLKKLYHNKFTYWSKIFIERYQYAFSPQYLFVNQEQSGIFSLWNRGQFFYHEAILIFPGVLFLFAKYRKEFTLLVLLLLISPLPSALGPDPVNYSIRSSLMLPYLALLTGAGIYSISYFIRPPRTRLVAYGLIAILYIYFSTGYFTQYYYEWMRYGASSYSIAAAHATRVILEEKQVSKHVVVDGFGASDFLLYAFYNKLSPATVQKVQGNSPIVLDSVVFHPICNTEKNVSVMEKNTSYIIPFDCVHKDGVKQFPFGNIQPSYVVKSPNDHDEWFVFSAQ